MNKNHYEIDFEEYIRQPEPDKKEKIYAWSTAIGLQRVDGLTPSKYLYDTAKQNIDGEISIDEAKNRIDSYYKSRPGRADTDDRTEEADKVSSRTAHILSEKAFTFSPSYLIAIHKRLFEGIFEFAGKIRTYDITKKEWILNGDTILYGAAFELKAALDYDFEQERSFSYKNSSLSETVKHITFFVSRLWQIHAFGEGNTRTTAVFTIKYLRYLGFPAENDIFAQNAWYFRNALVRANYSNLQNGIHENSEYLEKFFRNLLLGEHNELKNRFLHLDYNQRIFKSAEAYQSHDGTAPELHQNCPASARKTLCAIKENPTITTAELAKKLGLSVRTIKTHIALLKQTGFIERQGANKHGSWNIISAK